MCLTRTRVVSEPNFLFDFENGRHYTSQSPAPMLLERFHPERKAISLNNCRRQACLRVEEIPRSCRFSLAVSALFQLRARLGPPWHQRDGSPLTDPTVQISRSGFLKRDSLLKSRATDPRWQQRVSAEKDVIVLCVCFGAHQSPGEWQHSLPACLLDCGRAELTPAGFHQKVSPSHLRFLLFQAFPSAMTMPAVSSTF
jgi:hypothetical protein